MTITVKIKGLSPALREKKRYVAFKVHSQAPIGDFTTLRESISNSVARVLGELEGAKAGVWIVPDAWDEEEQKGLIRVNTKYVNKLIMSLTLIEKIGVQQVVVSSSGISGILKKAQGKYLAG